MYPVADTQWLEMVHLLGKVLCELLEPVVETEWLEPIVGNASQVLLGVDASMVAGLQLYGYDLGRLVTVVVSVLLITAGWLYMVFWGGWLAMGFYYYYYYYYYYVCAWLRFVIMPLLV